MIKISKPVRFEQEVEAIPGNPIKGSIAFGVHVHKDFSELMNNLFAFPIATEPGNHAVRVVDYSHAMRIDCQEDE